MREHSGVLHKVCRLYCSDASDREDLAQEILIQLWRSFGSFDGRVRFSTWMYRVALNTAISYLRGESTRKRHVSSGDPVLLELAAAPESESAELTTLYQLISKLHPLERALVLLYLEGHSYEETAEILGISATNVATKLNRLKHMMKMEAAVRTRQSP